MPTAQKRMGQVFSGRICQIMRDAGLEAAIGKAGGVGALARALGIAQPSVSSWSRIPAERVLAVEELTQVSRSVLRPDLYPDDDSVAPREIDDLDRARAEQYSLLAVLLGKSPDAALLEALANLRGDSSDLGMAQIELASVASLVKRASGDAGILQPLHRRRTRRTAALRLLLSHGLPQRAPARACPRRFR